MRYWAVHGSQHGGGGERALPGTAPAAVGCQRFIGRVIQLLPLALGTEGLELLEFGRPHIGIFSCSLTTYAFDPCDRGTAMAAFT
jgi:hypothetical protein